MIHHSYGIVAYQKTPQGKVEFLLVKNKSGDHWGFPKGTPDLNESPVETAMREFEEETGYKAPSITRPETFIEEYDFFTRDNKNIHKINTYYLAELSNQEKTGELFNDIEESTWKEYSEALKTLTFPRSREILSEALTTIQA